MDVRPVGAGPAGPDPARAARISVPDPPPGAPDRTGFALPPADSAAALIQELPASDLAKITRIIEPLPAPETATHLNGLLEAAASAAAQGHATQAMEFLAEFAQMDPQRAQALPSNPHLQPVRTEMEQLLGRLAALAKLDATDRLAHAAEVADGWGARKLPEWETGPEPLLAIANRLFESGTHAGYSHAAELAQSILDAARWTPVGTPVPPASPRAAVDLTEHAISGPVPIMFRRAPTARPATAPARARMLWLRAPLLVLLLAWLGMGIAGGAASWAVRRWRPDHFSPSLSDAGFELWGIGFLALILFGFYMRVRNVRL